MTITENFESIRKLLSSRSKTRIGDERSDVEAQPAEHDQREVTSCTSNPGASLLVKFMAAAVVTVIEVVNCMGVAVVLRGSLPHHLIDPFYRHCVHGFFFTQMATSLISNIPGVVAPCAFENLIIFVNIREVIQESMQGRAVEDQFVTFLACSSLSTLISAVMLAALAMPQVGNTVKLLPGYVRHGVFMAIGIGVFLLGFDAYELMPFETTTWTEGINWLKFIPAYLLGFGLWYICEHVPCVAESPRSLVLIGFIVLVSAGVHLTMMGVGMSRHDGALGGWVLAEVQESSLSEYFRMTYGSLDKVDFQVVHLCLPWMFMAAVVGPVLNVSINLAVAENLFQARNLSYPREFISQAVGALLSFLGFGFNSYIAIADTSIMHKAGGTDCVAAVIMISMLVLLSLFPPVLPVLAGTIPVLLPAAMFVYIGIDVMAGCYGEMRNLRPMEFGFTLLTCGLCVFTSVPVGFLVACFVCILQHYGVCAKAQQQISRLGFSLSRLEVTEDVDEASPDIVSPATADALQNDRLQNMQTPDELQRNGLQLSHVLLKGSSGARECLVK